LVYDEITALGDTGGYAGLAILANNSAALILSVCNLLRREWFWFTDTYPFDEDDYDEICAMIAQLESDIMTSAVGTVLPWAASALPGWGLLCDGTVYLKADYPELWAALGDDWEQSGTEFFVPDLVNRVVVGAGDDYSMAEEVGSATVILTEGQMPSHQHLSTLPYGGQVLSGELVPTYIRVAATTVIATSATGDDLPHDNVQPSLALNHIIVSGRYTDHGA
jgi:microcystin-dependent protein